MNFSIKPRAQGFGGIVSLSGLHLSERIEDYLNGKNSIYVENSHFVKAIVSGAKARVKKPFVENDYANAAGLQVVMPRICYKHDDGKFYPVFRFAWTNDEKNKRFRINPPYEAGKDDKEEKKSAKTVDTKKSYISTRLVDGKVAVEDQTIYKFALDMSELETMLFAAFVYNIDLSDENFVEVDNCAFYNALVAKINELYDENDITIQPMTEFDEEQFTATEYIFEQVGPLKKKRQVLHYRDANGDLVKFETFADKLVKFYNDNYEITQGKKTVENKAFTAPKFITNKRCKELYDFIPTLQLSNTAAITHYYYPPSDDDEVEVEGRLSFEIRGTLRVNLKTFGDFRDKLSTSYYVSDEKNLCEKFFKTGGDYENFQENYMSCPVEGIIYLRPEFKLTCFAGNCNMGFNYFVQTFDIDKTVVEEQVNEALNLALERRQVAKKDLEQFNEASEEEDEA